jgi:hypothetical protein
VDLRSCWVESKLSLGLAGLRPPGPRRCSSFSYSSLCVCARLNTSSFPRALSFLSPLPLGWPLPFIGWERGQSVVASLGRSRKAGVKLAFYLGWSHAYSWGSRLPDYLVFTMADDVGRRWSQTSSLRLHRPLASVAWGSVQPIK